MLGWITGQNEQFAHSADDSKVLEPPETPAPVFAIRAFKSALFGTPGAEDEENNDRESKAEHSPTKRPRIRSDTLKAPSADNVRDAPTFNKPNIDMAANAMISPTKSILVTPGTASNRRKTVSFGDGVVDNERKRDDPFTKPSKTPVNTPSSVSSQWMTSSSNGKNKPRSKLTQALMDSRDKSADPSPLPKVDRNPQSEADSRAITQLVEEDANDDTINLNEPHSQSGKYWKAEYDSYRTKTTREIKKLIQYRSAMKTYARKKDAEAARLADKLREEELRVAEMERHVTQLASTMVGENTKADKEQLVQELTKQTALALQYKHRVNLLRKLLERHGVVGGEMGEVVGQPGAGQPEAGASYGEPGLELLKTQQALSEASAKIEEMKRQQLEFTKLKDLAQSSEQKASELERENITLKQTLARVKQEMTKYEGRRKEKETKLKQREMKLELRVQEYRERLKTASQEHRELEEDLKQTFNEERRQMQEQIDLLKLKMKAIERVPETRTHPRYSFSPRKGYPSVQTYDFGQTSPQRNNDGEVEDIEEPPSPSPRAKDRRSRNSRNATVDVDLKRAVKIPGFEDNQEQLVILGDSPLKVPRINSYNNAGADGDETVPPSSPPIPSIEPSTRTLSVRQKYSLDDYRKYQPTLTTMTSLARHLADLDESQQIRTQSLLRTRRSPAKYSLDTLSGLPDSNGTARAGKRHSIATLQRDSIPVERMIAAQARLKQKDQSRKGKEEGKENIRAYSN